MAMKNFGSKSKEKDNGEFKISFAVMFCSSSGVTRMYLILCLSDVNIIIHRDGKSLGYEQVEQGYKDWVLKMHKTYDEEDASGEDDAIFIFDSLDNKALCISPDCKGM